MGFPNEVEASRWLALRDDDPAAFAALHPRAQEIAQDYADIQAAHEHRPPEKWSRRHEQKDGLLALRDSKEAADRDRFAALPDRTRDELQVYEDVVGKVAK